MCSEKVRGGSHRLYVFVFCLAVSTVWAYNFCMPQGLCCGCWIQSEMYRAREGMSTTILVFFFSRNTLSSLLTFCTDHHLSRSLSNDHAELWHTSAPIANLLSLRLWTASHGLMYELPPYFLHNLPSFFPTFRCFLVISGCFSWGYMLLRNSFVELLLFNWLYFSGEFGRIFSYDTVLINGSHIFFN